MTTSGSTLTTGPDAGRIRVAVGVVTAADGRVLVAERDAARHAGGGLEFPGGKIEPDEAPEQALARELAEEVGIHVQAVDPLIRLRHDYADREVELRVFAVTVWDGRPAGQEGQALHWLAPDDLAPDAFPAANRPIVACLQWPSRLAVTAPADDAGDAQGLAERIVHALRAGACVQIRRPQADERAWRALVMGVRGALENDSDGAAACERVQLNTRVDDPLVAATGFGLHLTAARAAACAGRPPGVARFSCSAHSHGELRVAEAIGVDYAVVGQVKPTPSHPPPPAGSQALGWSGLADLLAATALPVYAIGGLNIEDVASARAHGAVGVAGIRGFW